MHVGDGEQLYFEGLVAAEEMAVANYAVSRPLFIFR